MDYANITIGIISAVATVVAARHAYKAYLSDKIPKLVMETPDNACLFLRNVMLGLIVQKILKRRQKCFETCLLKYEILMGRLTI